MSINSSISGIFQENGFNSTLQNSDRAVFSSFKKAVTENKAGINTKKDTLDISKEDKEADQSKKDKEKKDIPWKKIGIAIAAATVFIEYNLRHDPRRKQKIKEYAEIFSNTSCTEIRNFNMIPYRDEVIITEAANGSKKAQELISEFPYDAEGIVKYIKTKRKIIQARNHFLEGRFEGYRTRESSNRKVQEKFFRDLGQLQVKADDLYQRCIVPLLKP